YDVRNSLVSFQPGATFAAGLDPTPDGRITYVVRNSDRFAFALLLHRLERLEVQLDTRHVGVHLERLAVPLDRFFVVVQAVVDLPEARQRAEVARVPLQHLAAIGYGALVVAREVVHRRALV